MRKNKSILFAGVCFFYLGLTTPAAINTDTAKSLTNAESGRQTFQQSRLLIAQDNADVQEAGDPGLNPENRSKPNAEKKTKQEAAPSKANTDPLPSYQPSEKIKADQAVDFPYDI
ncbi:MAG: hypothetical protein PVF56_21460 [Desulfobacterales bacterium]